MFLLPLAGALAEPSAVGYAGRAVWRPGPRGVGEGGTLLIKEQVASVSQRGVSEQRQPDTPGEKVLATG